MYIRLQLTMINWLLTDQGSASAVYIPRGKAKNNEAMSYTFLFTSTSFLE